MYCISCYIQQKKISHLCTFLKTRFAFFFFAFNRQIFLKVYTALQNLGAGSCTNDFKVNRKTFLRFNQERLGRS